MTETADAKRHQRSLSCVILLWYTRGLPKGIHIPEANTE